MGRQMKLMAPAEAAETISQPTTIHSAIPFQFGRKENEWVFGISKHSRDGTRNNLVALELGRKFRLNLSLLADSPTTIGDEAVDSKQQRDQLFCCGPLLPLRRFQFHHFSKN